MEKISVLMPVYNRETLIKRAIDSILNQTHKNLEIIIYDDGSTDGSLEYLDNLEREQDNVRVIFGVTNKGVGYARNQLLKACNTRYAIWMDSDDVSASNRIEIQLKAMTQDQLVYAVWENLKTKTIGTTRGFATLMFPVNKDILFPENMCFGAEDAVWREKMEKVYTSTDVEDVLYSIDFHGDRIGTWKRKIDQEWGGKYNLNDIQGLSYEEAINKFKKDIS